MAAILIVDDDPMIRTMMRLTLEGAGHRVDEAEDGDSVLPYLARQSCRLLIVDMLMPNRDGIETIRDVRKSYPDLHIIAISGGGRIGALHVLKLGQKFGAKQVLRKPFGRGELIAAVNRALGAASRGGPRRLPLSGRSGGIPQPARSRGAA